MKHDHHAVIGVMAIGSVWQFNNEIAETNNNWPVVSNAVCL